ncbi:hypothetical protein FLPS103535_08765 [Flavobacterium psychrophilum]
MVWVFQAIFVFAFILNEFIASIVAKSYEQLAYLRFSSMRFIL